MPLYECRIRARPDKAPTASTAPAGGVGGLLHL
jgi:hypothetical protein